MQRSLKQRIAIKFYVTFGEFRMETFPMIKTAFGDDYLWKRQVYRCHKALSEGREEVGDEARAGRPSTTTTDENVTHVREFLNSDRRLRVRLVAQTLNILKSTVHETVTNNFQL